MTEGQPDRRTRVFGWIAGLDGCAYYRVSMPLAALAQAYPTKFDVAWHNRLPDDTSGIDVIVGQRICLPGPTEHWQKLCADPGVRCVLEIDDDLLSIDEDNPGSPLWRSPWARDNLIRNIESADVVTVSTEPLAERLGKYNRNVVVLTNCVTAELFNLPPAVPEPYRTYIGWQGSNTHRADWQIVHDSLGRLLVAEPSVHVITAGANYTGGYPRGQVWHLQWTQDMGEHYRRVSTFDIGIAPLAHTRFTRSKSWIKVLEYMALGVPAVASDVPAYRSLIKNGVSGLLVKGQRAWGDALRLLVADPGLRDRLAVAGRETAQAHTIESNIHKWASVYGPRTDPHVVA